MHEADNKAIFTLAGATNTDLFPADIVLEPRLAAWPNSIGDVIKCEIGSENLMKIKDKVMSDHGFSGHDSKNALFIGYVVAEAWSQNLKSKTLIALCEALIKLGQSQLLVIPKNQAASIPSQVHQPELRFAVAPKPNA